MRRDRLIAWATAPVLVLTVAACGGGSASTEEWCKVATEMEDIDLDNVDFADPDAIKTAFDEMLAAADDAVDAAPDGIKQDVETLQGGFQDVYDELEKVDFDFLALDQSVINELDGDMTSAQSAIDEFNVEECGFPASADVPAAEDPTSEGDEVPTDDTLGSGSIRDMMVEQFVTMGLTEDEATCVAENLDMSEFADTEALDPNAFNDLFEGCGISAERLAELGG